MKSFKLCGYLYVCITLSMVSRFPTLSLSIVHLLSNVKRIPCRHRTPLASRLQPLAILSQSPYSSCAPRVKSGE